MGDLMTAQANCADTSFAPQQPSWKFHAALPSVLEALRCAPDVIASDQLPALRKALAHAAGGDATILQIGDCAEDPRISSESDIKAKVAFYRKAARTFSSDPAHIVGRIAGQYAKPRSSDTEPHHQGRIQSFRGTMVNGPEPTVSAREHDPRRMLEAHVLSVDTSAHLEACNRDWGTDRRVWTSHEALVLDYERTLVRNSRTNGELYLSSTHLPWVGKRTNDPWGAHCRLLAKVSNPVGAKLSPEDGLERALAIAHTLDPEREPGKLALIVRCGKKYDSVEATMRAIRLAGHSPAWMCDPMHGNTINLPGGTKTRRVDAIMEEIRQFVQSTVSAGVPAGGLHLEASHLHVAECADRGFSLPSKGVSTTLCDPRLNPEQALEVTSFWRQQLEDI